MESNRFDDNPEQQGILRQKIAPEKIARSKQFRHEMTPAETALWERLRANRLSGYHFRRQQIIQGFIVDFYCHRAKLIIEVDGDLHQEQLEYDRERDRALSEMGFHVIRIQNASIFSSLEQVIETIQKACIANSTSFPPSLPDPGREGDGG